MLRRTSIFRVHAPSKPTYRRRWRCNIVLRGPQINGLAVGFGYLVLYTAQWHPLGITEPNLASLNGS